MAAANGDLSACRKSDAGYGQCASDVALTSGDESDCDGIEDSVYENLCRQPFRDAEEIGSDCAVSDDPTDIGKRNKINGMARVSGRECICDVFAGDDTAMQLARSICLEAVAVTQKSAEACLLAEPPFRSDCLTLVAVRLKDTMACHTIAEGDNGGDSYANDCLARLALAKSDPAACDEFYDVSGYSVDECKANVEAAR